jgi:WD40 repeat protein
MSPPMSSLSSISSGDSNNGRARDAQDLRSDTSASTSYSAIGLLSKNIAIQIADFLKAEGLFASILVSRQWKLLFDVPEVWQNLCFSEFGIRPKIEAKKEFSEISGKAIAYYAKKGNLICLNILNVNREAFPLFIKDFNNQLTVGVLTGDVQILHRKTNMLLKSYREHERRLVFTCLKQGQLISNALGWKIKFWELDTNKRAYTIKMESICHPTCCDSKSLFSDKIEYIKQLDIDTGNLSILVEHKDNITCCAVFASKLVTWYVNGNIKVWDTITSHCTDLGSHKVGNIGAIEANQKYIVTASLTKIKIWDCMSFQCLRVLRDNKMCIPCLALQGQILIYHYGTGVLKILDLHTGVCLASFSAHQREINTIEIVGNTMLICADDHTVKIWGKEIG